MAGKAEAVVTGDRAMLAKAASSEEEALAHYRRVRDEIRAFVETLPGCLAEDRKP